MSSAALLDQDFGSESEDDNFNPAPADDSDNEAAGGSNAEVNSKPAANGAEQKRQSTGENDDDEGGKDTKGIPPVKGNGLQRNGRRESRDGEEDEEDPEESGGEDLNGADDDEDEEDEEDEEAVVCLQRFRLTSQLFLTCATGPAKEEKPPRPQKSIPRCRSRS